MKRVVFCYLVLLTGCSAFSRVGVIQLCKQIKMSPEKRSALVLDLQEAQSAIANGDVPGALLILDRAGSLDQADKESVAVILEAAGTPGVFNPNYTTHLTTAIGDCITGLSGGQIVDSVAYIPAPQMVGN